MGLSLNDIVLLMENSSLQGNKDDNLAVEAIKKGLDLRSKTKEGQTFWDDFMRVTGNAKALGHLLGVDPIQVSKWREKVNRYYQQVLAERKKEGQDKQKRNFMVHTGDNAEGPLANGRQPNQNVGTVGGPQGVPGMGNS